MLYMKMILKICKIPSSGSISALLSTNLLLSSSKIVVNRVVKWGHLRKRLSQKTPFYIKCPLSNLKYLKNAYYIYLIQ